MAATLHAGRVSLPFCIWLVALLLVHVPRGASSAEAVPPLPPVKTLPLPGEVFTVAGHAAFLIPASGGAPASASSAAPLPAKPWVWYAPTLPQYPAQEERWMFEQFLAAGIAVAGIDVGESYGSPAGRALFSALYDELVHRRGYAAKPVLLGRSRGGLMTLGWAADNPEKVAAFAGIYPVTNLVSYPGLDKAAPAYGLTPAQLSASLGQHNPVDRVASLVIAHVPLFAIHGDSDKIVPLENNSGLLHKRIRALGSSMELIVPAGQGHSLWAGFFECRELVAFVKMHALSRAP